MARKTPAPKDAGPADKGFRVRSRRESGFWRAGIHFTPEAQDIPFSELTEAAADLIWEEGKPGGQLIVDKIDIEPKQEPAT